MFIPKINHQFNLIEFHKTIILRYRPSQVKQHQYYFQYHWLIRNIHPTHIIFQGKIVTRLSVF